jgi:hypothetical protein
MLLLLLLLLKLSAFMSGKWHQYKATQALALPLSQHNCPLIALSPIRTSQRGFATGRAL